MAQDPYRMPLGLPYGRTASDYSRWLMAESRPSLTAQRQALGGLGAYATGQRSQALATAQQLGAQQAAGLSSLARTAQRGGYSAALQRAAGYGAETAGNALAARAQVAAQLEREAAARAYMQAASQAQQQALGFGALGRGYLGQAVGDIGSLYGQYAMRESLGRAYLRARQGLADQSRDLDYQLAGAGISAAARGLGMLAML